MEKRLIGKVALVTGSSGVIGPAIVRRLAAEGAVVAATDRSLETARAVADEAAASGGEVRAFALDVTDAAQVDSAFAAVEAGLGPVDILVNNAGFVRKSSDPFQLVEEELWSRILDVNLGGVIRCCRRVLGGMIARRYGKIINLGSIAGVSGLPGWADYAASKGGVIAFSKTIAMEAWAHGVTVNCVSPGMIGVESGENRGTWLGRSGTGEDVAGVIAFLASPEADYITGCNYMVDGGRVVGPKNASWNE